MGADPLTLGIGAAAVGGLSGALKGGKGTPAQTALQNSTSGGTSTSTQTRNVAPATPQEQALQDASMSAYQQQAQLAQQGAANAGSGDALQAAAQGASQNVLNGQAFQLTPQEQDAIMAQRNALVNQGSTELNQQLDNRLRQVVSQGATQGLRGQALGQVQGQVLNSAAQQFANISNNANTIAAQQAQAAPLNRVNAQSGYVSQGLTYADQLRQRAQQNLQLAQSPYLLGLLNQNRMATGSTTTSGSQTGYNNGTNTTPGQPGGFANALMGGFGGAVSGLGTGVNLASGINNLNALQARMPQFNGGTVGNQALNAPTSTYDPGLLSRIA